MSKRRRSLTKEERTRHYYAWREMRRRCYERSRAKYHRYGGRGIRVCDEWRTSYEAFYRWAMANGFKPGLQLDRIDNDGNYTPENCRYIDARTNVRNSPHAKLTVLTAFGVHAIRAAGISAFDIAVHLDMSVGAVRSVLSRQTWKDAGEVWDEVVAKLSPSEKVGGVHKKAKVLSGPNPR